MKGPAIEIVSLCLVIVDFHTHSLASDGALAPSDLLAQAKSAGVTRFAITDHDTLAGYEAIKTSPLAREVGLISGVELSCRWASATIHVVGLGFNPSSDAITSIIELLTDARIERAKTIAARLERSGITGALVGAQAVAQASQIGRPHFAQWLLQEGHVASVAEAFDKYLGTGKMGDVKTFWPSMNDVVGAIAAAGGIAIMAHPLKYKLTGMKLRALLNDFTVAGGRALEVLNGRQTDTDIRRLGQMAESLGLLVSAGSDFHRNFEYGAAVGVDTERLPSGRYVWDALGENVFTEIA